MTKLYTIKELEEILGLSHTTLRNYIYQGKLKATKLGGSGKWKITEEDLKAFIAGNKPDDSKSELKAVIDTLTPEQAQELLSQIKGA